MNYVFSRSVNSTLFRVTMILPVALGLALPALCGPIHEAAKNGDLATVQNLVRSDPSLINSKDEAGRTPLHWAAEGDGKIYKNASWEETGTNQPMYSNVPGMDNVSTSVLQFLLDNMADVNAADDKGQTPLHLAASMDNLKAAKVLLDHGARVTAKDKDGNTPLHESARHGYVDISEFLLSQRAEVNARNNIGGTPLLVCSLYLSEANLLLNRGADPNSRDDDGGSSLTFAIQEGDIELVALLIDKKADIKAVFKGGTTLLQMATHWNQERIARFLLTKGVQVNQRDENGWTALHFAALDNLRDVAQLLLANGADINAQTGGLRVATYFGDGLSRFSQFPGGHDPSPAIGETGATPLKLAEAKGNGEMAELLRRSGGHE
jgi:cytohesin